MKRFASILAITSGILPIGRFAWAQATPPEPATIAATAPTSLGQPATMETQPPTRASHAIGYSVYWENDGNVTKLNNPSDRHYTAGTAAAIQWQNPQTNAFVGAMPSLNGEFSKDAPGTSYGMGFIAALQLYTPDDISARAPIPDDRPYAGLAYGGLMVQRANRAADVPVFEHFELDLGTIGPTSQANKLQDWVHRRFGKIVANGWNNEIKDDFGGDLKYLRRWRIDLSKPVDAGKPSMQLIPEAGITAGTMHINASAAVTLRYGWNMPDDFGPGRMRYASDFTRPFTHDSPFGHLGGYVFVRPGGRAVAHDSTLEGSYFRTSEVEVTQTPLVAEIQAGVAIQFAKHFEVSYAQTYTSPEFSGQSMWDSYGTLLVTMVYAW